MRKRGVWIAGAWLCLALAGFGPIPARTASAAGAGEQLYIIPPAGWKVVDHAAQGAVDQTRMSPPSETIQNWTQMLTVVVVNTPPPDGSVDDLLRDQRIKALAACDTASVGTPQAATENGYQTVLRPMLCSRSKQGGLGQIDLYKILQGRDRLYIVSRSWRGPPFDPDQPPLTPAMKDDWLTFMSQVTVCDTSVPGHPCP